ncbi:UDP-forming cellulose synthase catalytic subunit [Oceanobacter sp. 4_MG-2023]|uniref:UDP-forming cellulose synthase catalytic subunit n=2 Tax=unclassified Oceanobacter TaxID=2620260 RepID=UPI0027372EBC|nr:UDP-forming cellulose synthase catalytic subunit [Oceanobacter sp. 4_MG-2023]MDP2546493.1 UDP-forming cellulose synthase catalytic subunit [Oceanobacter sp. 4_MG-2023]
MKIDLSDRARGWLMGGGGVLVILLSLYISQLRVDVASQAVLAYSMVGVVILLRFFESRVIRNNGSIEVQRLLRILILITAFFVSMRYFAWRQQETITYYDLLSFICMLILFMAEIYGIIISFLGSFVNIQGRKREHIPLPDDPDKIPSVDIFIPSYNEPQEMLEITLLAALQVRYPADKLNVCLLDDGGTVGRRNSEDPERASSSQERYDTLKAMCERIGATYLTREKNNHAKAGNINAALEKTNGEHILILDADHVPTRDILERMVGIMINDPKMFLVQSPHFFINPDPVEKNLQTYGKMPGENEMFYGVIQEGLDFWDSSFFCGSAALIRRKYLLEVGGISGDSITEDAETAFLLHAKGYRSAYVNRPMIAGLQPETYSGFVVQRMRWAQGMVQIFMLKNPLFFKGLKPWQRLCYTSSSGFWFFPFARATFLVAPSAYLFFGLKIYDANMTEFFSYALPHLMGALIVTDFLFGRYRWALVSELYELMQSLYSLPAILEVIKSPRSPEFAVTPKGEFMDENFITSLAGPFYWLLAFNLASLTAGFIRLQVIPQDSDVILITMFWEAFNLSLMVCAIGALYELKQRRQEPRVNADIAARVIVNGKSVPATIVDMSSGGLGVRIKGSVFQKLNMNLTGQELVVRAYSAAMEAEVNLPGSVIATVHKPDDSVVIGIKVDLHELDHKRQLVALVYGDSELWVKERAARMPTCTVRETLWFLFSSGARSSAAHFRQLWIDTMAAMRRKLRGA